MQTIRGAVFDMDGLLLYTERISLKANRLLCLELGFDIPLLAFTALVGRDHHASANVLSNWTKTKISPGQHKELWSKKFSSLVASEVKLRPTVKEALQILKQKGLPLAVATTSEKDHAKKLLEQFSIDSFFVDIVGYGCVSQRKPAPDPYILAARKIKIPPCECVAFEDSSNGVMSAKSAGMIVVQVLDIAPRAIDAPHFVANTVWEGIEMVGLI